MKLTTQQAQAVIAAAVKRASDIGIPMNIAVLDAGGHLKSFLRMDGAVLGSIDVAMKKAKTAVLFEANSEAVWEYCKPGASAPALELTNGMLAPFAGGIPLRGAGEVLGAIGVSGGAVSQDAEINPGPYLTGYNETMADTPFRWLDDSKNFTKRAAMRATFDSMLGKPEGRLDPEEMVARMIDVVPADSGKFRNVCPQAVENMLKQSQLDAWERRI